MTDGVKEGYGWSQEISISLHEKIKKDLKKRNNQGYTYYRKY